MDEEGTKVIEKWLCEFALRHQKNPRISMKKLLSTLRLEEDDDCSTLKKLAILRDIWNQLIHGTVDEQLLDLLEMFEKVLLLEGSAILQSLKSSYCWVAAECTIRYMLPMSNMEEFLYLDALKRIWDLRIRVLKEKESDLLTQELIDWGDNLKNAIGDPQLYQRLSESNAKYTAISHLCKFVKEHWELMGYSSLELEVQRRFQSKGNNTNVEGDNGSSRDTVVDAQKGEKDVRPDGAEGGERLEDVQDEIDVGEVIDRREQEKKAIDDKCNARVAEEVKECLFVLFESFAKDGNGETCQNDMDPTHGMTPEPRQDTILDPDQNKEAEIVNKGASENEGTSNKRVRLHLPSPEPLDLSPLKKGRFHHPQNNEERRMKKGWSNEEVEALREGVKIYGKSWKAIKDAYSELFANRTQVNLKDKWRNLAG